MFLLLGQDSSLVLGQKLMIGSFVLVHVFLGVPMFKSLGDVGIVFQ